MTTETKPADVKTADVAPQPRHTAPRKAAPKTPPTRKKAAPRAKKAAKPTKRAKAKKAAKPTRTATILTLVGKKSGATLAQIMKATDWQAHSVRGFISLAQSRRGLKIVSSKNAKGERVYILAKGKGK
jgi:hypothetical protein